MSKKSETPSTAAVDDTAVRRDLCKQLADGMRSGVFGFQFRFVRSGEVISEAWLYDYQEHHWHKRGSLADSPEVARELFHQIEMISTREFADTWSCRRIDHADHTDFELKFHREAIQAHLEADLESYLMGCLFSGHHDSGPNQRRRIRFEGR
jgi:hypothetical protein